MRIAADSPVQPISVGQALKISLDNYYDLLKTNTGGLQADEYLQLKLVADICDLSAAWPPAAPDGAHYYPWFSYYNLLQRADKGIVPRPLSAGVETGAARLSTIYGDFLQQLRGYVVKNELSADDQLKVADHDKKIESLQAEMLHLIVLDRGAWNGYADAMGISRADRSAYVHWSGTYGHAHKIQQDALSIQNEQYDIKTIMDRQYPHPDDRRIVEAEWNYTNSVMRLRYPLMEDYQYEDGKKFSPGYLGMMAIGSSAQFDDRLAIAFTPSMDTIKTGVNGHFDASWDRSTASSSSISTDWGTSASGGFGPFSASVSASDATQINEDFKKTTGIRLIAQSAFKVGLNFPAWFDPTLFEHRHVKENIQSFSAYFGPHGSLLYYPTGLILVRGFSVSFTASQNWAYDYKNNFSASASGGFSCFGIGFGGGSAHYNSDVHEHQIDQQNTSLTLSDDNATLRFVGYIVKKNSVVQDSVATAHASFGIK